MIVPSFSPAVGGAEIQAERLAAGLTSQGWDVRVITRRHLPGRRGALAREEIVQGVPVVRIHSPGPGKIGSALFALGALMHLGRSGRGDIYHAHGLSTAAAVAAVAAWLWKGKSVVKLRTGAPTYRRRLDGWPSGLILRRNLRAQDLILVLNSEVAKLLEEEGFDPDRIRKLPNGVDLQAFNACSALQRDRLRARLGFREGERVALSVGRLAPVKGFDLLLEAWAKLVLQSLGDGWRLVIVGDGPEREALEDLIGRRGMNGRVTLAGRQEDVRSFYQAADLFVLPSREEGMSNALLEAMACRLPVVVSDVGAARDLVGQECEEMIFPADDVEALADALRRMMKHSNRWAALGQRGRDKVERTASFDHLLPRLEEEYRRLVR
jgi:glycosyltransferase involved in cell wall biosynthesis